MHIQSESANADSGSSDNPWAAHADDGSHLTVDNFPTTLIVTLGNSLRRLVTAPYAEQFGLTVSEWRLLSLLAHYSPTPFGELVKLSGADKAQVSRTMRQLEERGLVEMRPDENGSKKKLDCLITRSGRALHKKVIPVARERQAKVLSVLSAEERVALYNALKKLHRLCDDGSVPEEL